MVKKSYLIFTISIVIIGIVLLIVQLMYQNYYHDDYVNKYDHPHVCLGYDDEEYLIYPGDSIDKWNIIFPSGDEYVELKPEQIAFFLKSGEINPDTAWVLHPQSEYQLTIEEDYIIVSDFNRPVAQLPLNQTGKLGNILIKDNE